MAQPVAARPTSRARPGGRTLGGSTGGSGSNLFRGNENAIAGAARVKASRVTTLSSTSAAAAPRRLLGDKSNAVSQTEASDGSKKDTVVQSLKSRQNAGPPTSRRLPSSSSSTLGPARTNASGPPKSSSIPGELSKRASSSSQPAPSRRERVSTADGVLLPSASSTALNRASDPTHPPIDAPGVMECDEVPARSSSQPARGARNPAAAVAGVASSSIPRTVELNLGRDNAALRPPTSSTDDEDMSDVDSDWPSTSGSSARQSSKTDDEEAHAVVLVKDATNVADSDGGLEDSELEADEDDEDLDVESTEAEELDMLDEEEEDDLVGASQAELDPDCVISLPPSQEEAAQRKIAAISSRYTEEVLRVAHAQRAEQRASLVAQGRMASETAAHEEELLRLGLDPDEARDISMVAEYSEEIFAYMARCERSTMPNPDYMSFQGEIEWHMRSILVDWLLQVHMRYHMLPETLWIAINIVDRFLSVRVVSLAKLQLVGVTAMFVAAKYEEILAPSVDEFVFMTENGYKRDEILKGERIILSTLDFNISSYCSPYSWIRRISKADDYDVQTRTLCKFLIEVSLHDHNFLRARPSLTAAIGMFLSKKMLGGQWNDAFVYYSGFVEEQLVPGANLLIAKLLEAPLEESFVFRKYAHKKFLKASIYARTWAVRHRAASTGNASEVASSVVADAGTVAT